MSGLWLPPGAGSGDTSDKGVKFKWNFQCPMRWNDLTTTDGADPNVRHCTKCNQHVHLVTSFQNFLESVEKGRCVAVDEQDFAGLFASHRQAAEGPCVVKRRAQARTDYQMPEMLGRVDMAKDDKDFTQKPSASEERDDFGDRRMGRVVKRKRPKHDEEE